MQEFRYDERKSDSNERKHGISFQEAKAMWNGRTFEFPIKNSIKIYGEMRYMALGEIDGRPLVAIISYRGGPIRLISVRGPDADEAKLYADSIQKAQQAAH